VRPACRPGPGPSGAPGLPLTHGPVLGRRRLGVLGVQEAVPRPAEQLLPAVAEVVGDAGEDKRSGGLSRVGKGRLLA